MTNDNVAKKPGDENYVSPYLKRSIRSLKQAIADEKAKKSKPKKGGLEHSDSGTPKK